MILRLIIKKDDKYSTRDISFYWTKDYTIDKKTFMTDNIPEEAMTELLNVDIVGAEMLSETTDFEK